MKASQRPVAGLRLTDELIKAFERGQVDQRRGVSYHACPYAESLKVARWEAGWRFEYERRKK